MVIVSFLGVPVIVQNVGHKKFKLITQKNIIKKVSNAI